MRVLHVIDSSRRGGGQIHVRGLLLELARKGLELHLAAPADGNVFDGLNGSGITLHEARLSKFSAVKNLRDLVHILRRLRPDILHLHGSVAGVWGRCASACMRDVAVVYTYHGVHFLRDRVFPRSQLFCFADRILSGLSDRVICVSGSDRDLIGQAGLMNPEKITVIRNGIDTGGHPNVNSSGMRESMKFSENDRLITCVARLHRQKGHVFLLEAAVSILERYRDTTFLFVGDGPERKSLERRAAHLGIGEHVLFLGERDDVPALLSISDLFVLPSLWEGLPLSILEAALKRIPMVATEIPGITEVLEDGVTAVLVKPANPDELADGVDRVFGGKVDVETMTDNALRLVKKEHDLEQMAERTAALYRDVLEGTASREGER